MATQLAESSEALVAGMISKVDTIATLPEVIARIIATVNDPNSSAADLHRIISHDPALVARILKVVNSALYARPNKIDTIERAIVLLGFDAVQQIAITTSVGNLFTHAILCKQFTARDVWVHSVAVAAAAREIARRVQPSLAEPAFLAGLIHDIGLLVESHVCPAKLAEVCDWSMARSQQFHTIEQEQIGCDHAQLGGALAAKWGFPAFCQTVAAHHHNLPMADPEHRQITAIVYTADTLCCQDAIGFDRTAVLQTFTIPDFDLLVPPAVVDEARQQLPKLVSDAIMVLGT